MFSVYSSSNLLFVSNDIESIAKSFVDCSVSRNQYLTRNVEKKKALLSFEEDDTALKPFSSRTRNNLR